MNTAERSLKFLALGFCFASIFVGCGPTSTPETSGRSTRVPAADVAGSTTISPSRSPAPDIRTRHLAFLNKIRQADPQFKVIEKAILNEQNELGLVLVRTVSMDTIPALMKTMLAQLAREFPSQDLNVIAYTPSDPPRKIGTAHLNARKRDMTYTPAAVPDR